MLTYQKIPTVYVDRADEKISLPIRATKKSAGIDLYSTKKIEINGGERILISTGCKFKFPEGCFGLIKERSSLALKYGLTVSGGVIDEDYQGVVGVIMFNTSKTKVILDINTRIAQLVVIPYSNAPVKEINDITINGKTVRGEGGYGSTGKN